MDVFDRLEPLIQQKNWRKSELVRRIGIDRAQYEVWEAKRKIPDDQYPAVAQALDTTIAYLRGEVDTPDIPPVAGQETAHPAEKDSSNAPTTESAPPILPPEQAQQIQRIVRGLQGLDARGLTLVEGLMALYLKTQGP